MASNTWVFLYMIMGLWGRNCKIFFYNLSLTRHTPANNLVFTFFLKSMITVAVFCWQIKKEKRNIAQPIDKILSESVNMECTSTGMSSWQWPANKNMQG